MARALDIVGIDSRAQAVTDKLVREIDPDFVMHRQARWAARPTGNCPKAHQDYLLGALVDTTYCTYWLTSPLATTWYLVPMSTLAQQ